MRKKTDRPTRSGSSNAERERRRAVLRTDVDEGDKDLVIAFQAGEDGAYQAIYDRYQSRVRGICHRMIFSREDAEEAAQEVFVRIFQALVTFDGQYRLSAWITRVSTNVCLDHLRRARRRPSLGGSLAEAEAVLDAAPDSDPEFLYLRDSLDSRVYDHLRSLPDRHRRALLLRDVDGLSYADLARRMGLTEGQVKALLHRARARFRREWSSANEANTRYEAS